MANHLVGAKGKYVLMRMVELNVLPAEGVRSRKCVNILLTLQCSNVRKHAHVLCERARCFGLSETGEVWKRDIGLLNAAC